MGGDVGHGAGFHVIAGNAGIGQHPLNGEMVANRGERGGRRELGARAADEHHVARSGIDELASNQTASLFMIRPDDRHTLTERAVESDNWPMDGGPVVGRMLGVGRHDDAVHHVPLEHVDVLALALVCIGGGAEQGFEVARGELALQMRGECGEERVGDGRHDHADGVGAVSVEVAGQLVGNVVELAHRGLDFGTHISRDVAGVVDHQRNGA